MNDLYPQFSAGLTTLSPARVKLASASGLDLRRSLWTVVL